MVLDDPSGKSVTKLDKNYNILWTFQHANTVYFPRTMHLSPSKTTLILIEPLALKITYLNYTSGLAIGSIIVPSLQIVFYAAMSPDTTKTLLTG
jgi:hypothetical protein